MRVLMLVALLAFACERRTESDHAISKQMDITYKGKTETCVDGDASTCAGAGGRWSVDVARCCLPKSTCVLAEEATCRRAKGAWTGKYCCIAADSPPHPIMEKWSATMAECLESLQQSDGSKIKDRTKDEPEHVSGHLEDGRHFACDKMPTTWSPGNYFLGYYNVK